MLKEVEGAHRHGWRLAAYSLSGRLLLLTILFVMLSVALIYFPSVARYHHQLLQDRINSAQLAILPFTEAPGEQLSERLRTQLLARAGVVAVILRGGGQHELFLSGAEPPQVETVYDAGETDLIEQIRDVLRTLFAPQGRTIRIDEDLPSGRNIVVIANEGAIRAALFVFSTRALLLSVFVSVVTSFLVFVSLYLIFVRPMQRITAAMAHGRAQPDFRVQRVDYVGPQVGNQLRNKGIAALLYAMLAILVYVAFRFDFKFGPGALVAMVHDVIMVSGYYLVTRREFNLTSIAVLLTITGYSINDTIVIYDRIREEMARYKGKPLPEIINIAVNDTLSRTILTSGVTALSLVGLLIFGVGEIWDFAMAMLVGIVVGTYSSVYIASPLTIWLDERAAKKKAAGGAMKVRAA